MYVCTTLLGLMTMLPRNCGKLRNYCTELYFSWCADIDAETASPVDGFVEGVKSEKYISIPAIC